MIVVGAGSAALVVAGLSLVGLAPDGLWSRLLGLQWAAMGLYLLTLARLGRGDLLRPLLGARLAVAAGALLLGAVWLAVIEAAWATLGWLSLSETGASPRLVQPSRLHNLLLGVFPLVEGLACLFFAAPVSALLYVQPAVQPWAGLFALQSLYLAGFWWLCVWRDCPSGLAVTIIGRLLVAGTFAAVWLSGGAGRIGLLAAALVVSCVWSALEVRRLPGATQNT